MCVLEVIMAECWEGRGWELKRRQRDVVERCLMAQSIVPWY